MTPSRVLLAVIAAAAMIALGLSLGRYGAFLMHAVAIAAIGALSLNLLIGYCGQISFAQGALLGVGAYTAGNIGNAGGDVFALLGAGIAGALVSALIGLPALRLRGLYFAIATVAAQAILEYLFKTIEPLTHGISGLTIRRQTVFGMVIASDQATAVVSIVVLLLVWLGLAQLMRTNLGRSFLVIRESEVVAKGMGIDVPRTKMWAFVISGFVAGIAGGLMGFATRLASPETFTLDLSADYVAMIIVGGLGSSVGPIIGAAFVRAVAGSDPARRRGGQSRRPALRLARDGVRVVDHPVSGIRAARSRGPRTSLATGANPQAGRGTGGMKLSGGDRIKGGSTMKKWLLGSLLAVCMGAAAPAGAAGLNVCIWGTITGPDALVNGMSYGIRDYLEYLNQSQGGIAGNKVNTILLDGRYKLDEELKIYRRCVDEENAAFISGWSTGAVKALRDQITEDKVPFITQSFASEVLDPVKLPFIFMAGPTYEQQMIIGLRDLAAKGGKRVVLMHADNEYGRGPVNVIKQSGVIEKLGLTLADEVEFRYDAQDLTAQMLRIKAANPDLVYIQSSAPQALVALRDAAKVGLPAKLFMGNLYDISPAIPEQLGQAAEGFRAIQIYNSFGADIPAMKQIAAFREKNKLAKEDVYYMKGWLEGVVIAAALESAIKKNDGKIPDDIKAFRLSVRDAAEGLKGLDDGGITPPLDYSGHQGSTLARIAEIKDGKYVPVGDWIDAR